jgi:hypothetical protein
VNAKLAGKRGINSHDLVCIRRVHPIQSEIKFCYTQKFASPRYSQQFVEWIAEQFKGNPAFFEEARAKYDRLKDGK